MTRRAVSVALAAVLAVIASLFFLLRERAASPTPHAELTNPSSVAKSAVDETARMDVDESVATPRPNRTLAQGETGSPPTDNSKTTLVLIAIAVESGEIIPYPNFTVREYSIESSTPSKSDQGDAQGRAEFEVRPDQELSISAAMSDGALSTADVVVPALTLGERREVRIHLDTQPNLRFFCRVVRDEDGAKMPFVRAAHVHPSTSILDLVHDELTADAQGLIEVHTYSWQQTTVQVDVEGYAQAVAAVVRGYETSERAFELRLYRGAKLNIEVVDPAARALPGLTVRARAHDYELSQSELWSDRAYEVRSTFEALTDETGHVVLSGLPPRVELELSVNQGNETLMLSPVKHRLDPGEERSVRLIVGGKATLAGRAIDQFGAPLEGATLFLVKPDTSMGMTFRAWTSYKARTLTRAGGAFEFNDVAEGEWWVGPAPKEASDDRDAIASYGQSVKIAPGAGRVEIVLNVWRGLFLRGTVRLNSGELVSDCSVGAHALDFDHTGYLNAKSDAQGAFKIGPLCGVDYELTAGGAFQGEFAESKPLIVPGGSENLVLIVERAAILRGKVVDAATGEACEASIYITQSGISDGFGYSMGSETSNNAFEMTGITAGVWDVTARSRNSRIATARVSFTPGETKEITLRVAPSVTVVFKNTSPTEFFYVFPACDGISLEVVGAEAAQEQRIAVPPGRVTLRICDANAKTITHRTVEIAPGSSSEVTYP